MHRIYDKVQDGLSKNDHLPKGVIRFEAKHAILREAIRAYLAQPTITPRNCVTPNTVIIVCTYNEGGTFTRTRLGLGHDPSQIH